MTTTLTSREFNQDTGFAKKAAASGPVIITDRGKPSHVLLSIEDFERLSFGSRTILDLLAMPQAADIAFAPPTAAIGLQAADFS